MKQYVVQELPLFNLKTVPCAGSTGRSGLTFSGNTVLGFLFSEFLGRVLQRFPAAEFPNQAAKPLREGFSYLLSEITRLEVRA